MVATIPTNPYVTTTGLGSFNVDAGGFVQGTALDQPAIRNTLAGGILAVSETIPMWGGVAISEAIPTPGTSPLVPNTNLGSVITRATNVAANAAGTVTGFSVFDQDHAMVNSPQSPVPLTPSYGQVNFYRLGSGARIAVQCDPSIATLEGGVIAQKVSWDFSQQMLVPSENVIPVNLLTALSWGSQNGGQATGSTTSNHGIAVGQEFTISGVVPAGYNGSFVAVTGTTGNILVWALAANPGVATTLGQVDSTGGVLPVQVLEVKIGNCMTVVYNPTTGQATWNRNGNCAIILI